MSVGVLTNVWPWDPLAAPLVYEEATGYRVPQKLLRTLAFCICRKLHHLCCLKPQRRAYKSFRNMGQENPYGDHYRFCFIFPVSNVVFLGYPVFLTRNQPLGVPTTGTSKEPRTSSKRTPRKSPSAWDDAENARWSAVELVVFLKRRWHYCIWMLELLHLCGNSSI